MTLRISGLIKTEWIFPDLIGSTKVDVLSEIARRLEQAGTGIEAEDLLHRLLERENKASTGADHGLAIPHAVVPSAQELVVSVGRVPRGVDFGALDNERSKLFFTIVAPARTPRSGEPSYLQAISAVCKLMRSPQVRQKVLLASSADEIISALIAEEAIRDARPAAGV